MGQMFAYCCCTYMDCLNICGCSHILVGIGMLTGVRDFDPWPYEAIFGSLVTVLLCPAGLLQSTPVVHAGGTDPLLPEALGAGGAHGAGAAHANSRT